jgi:hypothetical protein
MRPVWLARPRSPRQGSSAGCEVTARSATGVLAIGFLPNTIGVGEVKDCLGGSLGGFLGQVVSGIGDLAVGAGAGEVGRLGGVLQVLGVSVHEGQSSRQQGGTHLTRSSAKRM